MTPFPLSHPQRRIWFAQNEHPESNVNSFAGLVALPTDSVDEVQSAWNTLVERVDAFRLRIVPKPCPQDPFPASQVVAPYQPVPVDRKAFASWGEAETWIEETLARPIPLSGQLVFPTAIQVEGESTLHLFVNFHHIVSDGWSYDLTLRYILGLLEGKPVPHTTYQEFVELERTYLDSPSRALDKAFWTSLFAEELEAVDLAFSGETSMPFCLGFVIAPETVAKAQDFARSHGLSLYKQFTTALSVVTARLARVERFTLAFANHNRTQKSFYATCGMFVSTLPQLVVYQPELNFVDFCRAQSQDLETAIKDHSRYPFDLLVSECRREMGLDLSGLTKLSLVGHPDRKRDDRGFLGSTADGLAIHFNQDGRSKHGHLTVHFYSDGKTASRVDCDRIFRAVSEFWAQALEHPETSVAHLDLLTDEEWGILENFNAQTAPIDPDRHVLALIEEQAAKRPNEIAVVAPSGNLTWRQLVEASEETAARLLSASGRSSLCGEFVGVCLRRDIDLMPGILGVLRTGAAYVPLDPEYPRQRIQFMLEDAGIRVALAHPEFSDLLENVALVDPGAEGPKAPLPSLNSFKAVDRAYAIYTSGTTGKPKGVPIDHGQLSHLIQTICVPFGLNESSVALLYASLNFDASVVELFVTLANGSRLVICDEATRVDATALLRLMADESVTWATLPPALLAVLPATNLPKLQTLVVAGESTDAAVIESWSKGRTMLNGYGPTENTVATTVGDFATASSSQDIGRPLVNHRCYVLDRGMKPVPIGVPGELHVAAPTVSEGYLHRPDLTQERFSVDPFHPSRHRLYKTGDLVTWLPTGRLEFIGRVDFQVKIRGHRIECQEISTILSGIAGVKSCLVIPVPSGATQKLVAYILTECDLDSAALRAGAEERLPEYMVPSAFVFLKEFPRTPAGKIDRRALPEPDFSQDSEVAHQAPSTPEEGVLAEIWSEVLGIDNVGVRHNFYHLGGDSLLALRMLSMAEERGLPLTLEQLRKGPTIRELALSRESFSLPTLTQAEGVFPSPLPRNALMMVRQEQTLARHEVETSLLPGTWTLKGELDVARMISTLTDLVERHQVFRLRLDGDRMEKIETIQPIVCREVKESELPALLAAEQKISPELPDCRLSLFRLAPDLHVVASVCSHEMMDAWARGVLEREMVALYNGQTLPPAHSFSDFANWYRELLQTEKLSESHDYWVQKLAGAETVFTLPPQPADETRPYDAVMSFSPLDPSVLRGFGGLCKERGATLFEGLYTAFHLTLGELSGKFDILTGYVFAIRANNSLQSVVGGLTNRLYLRTDLPAGISFEAALLETRQTLDENLKHALWPAWEVRDSQGAGFPGVFFHYVPQPEAATAEFAGLERVPSAPPRPLHWPLGMAFQVMDHAERPMLCVLGRQGYIDEAYAELCMKAFVSWLTKIVTTKGSCDVLTHA